MRSGHGRLIASEERIYEGGFKENREHGYGSFNVWSNFDVVRISGGVRDGKLHGYAEAEIFDHYDKYSHYSCCETGYNNGIPDGYQNLIRDCDDLAFNTSLYLGTIYGFVQRIDGDRSVYEFCYEEPKEPSDPCLTQ